MTEMLRLIRANDIKAKDVKRVRVGTNHNMPNALIHHRPVNELQAKFSMEFCMAILLLEGRAGLGEFTDEVVLRPDVKAMIEKIDFVVDSDAEAAGYHKMTTIIDIELDERPHDLGPRRLRQGQPGQSDELRRGGRKVPAERGLREIPGPAGGVGGGHGARLRDAAFGGAPDGGAHARRPEAPMVKPGDKTCPSSGSCWAT